MIGFQVGKSIKVIFKFLICLFWPLAPIEWVCWFSSKFFDIHDYYEFKGGDGYPAHFYTYTCWNCGKKFEI
jgi:hypothetical protein